MMRPDMTATVTKIPLKSGIEPCSRLETLHGRVRESLVARTALFAVSTTLLFAMYLGLNWPHIGVNARLHWDAETSICSSDPMPRAIELAYNRQHIYDIANEIHSNDPVTVTAYFTNGKASGEHAPLEIVRRYYSQISYWLGRAAFDFGARWIGTPVGAVLCFQLAAMVTVAVSMGLLLTFAIVCTPPGPQLLVRLGMLLLAFTAIASQIIFLSIARQVLTETVGLLFWVCAIVTLAAAVHPRRSLRLAAVLAGGTGAFVFAAIRSRYNLGPSIALLVPLVVLVTVPIPELFWQWKRYLTLSVIAGVVFAALVGADVVRYGPFFMPWVYDQTLVRSASLYFHADPPYALFWVMVYNNFPLLLLPIISLAFALSKGFIVTNGDRISARQLSGVGLYWIAVLVILIGMITLMARQAVGYQGRHLFALSAAAVIAMLMIMGRMRWGRTQLALFVPVCVLVIVLNVHSTFGRQRLVPGELGRPSVRESLASRWASRANKATLLVDLCNGYFEWADDDRLHDPLVSLQFIARHSDGKKPLLLLSGNTESAKRIEFLANRFGVAQVCWLDKGEAILQTAKSDGRAVFIVETGGAREQLPVGFRSVGLALDRGTLFETVP